MLFSIFSNSHFGIDAAAAGKSNIVWRRNKRQIEMKLAG
jgi:hypothetical protein